MLLWCIIYVYFVFFFFQAEDGIRDLVRSRGLGDVYKRQTQTRPIASLFISPKLEEINKIATSSVDLRSATVSAILESSQPVSYTHLTLPTIYSV